jgi:hypothetical protein
MMLIMNETEIKNDPFPKWKWMMDYCRIRKWHPSDFWDLAEKAWNEKTLTTTK